MTNPHTDFFAAFSRARTDDLRGVYAPIMNARGTMGLLYHQAALMVTAAQAQGVGVTLQDWITCDQFSIKVGLQEVWISRAHDVLTITFNHFTQADTPHSKQEIAPRANETPTAFAFRVIEGVRSAFWPDPMRST